MKNILIALVVITFASCGGNGKYGDTISDLSAAKDSLVLIYQDMENELLALEDELYAVSFKEFEKNIDSLEALLSAATDTLIQRTLYAQLKILKEEMNNAKQKNITELREWLKSRNEAFNERITEIDLKLADLEGKVTRVTLVSSHKVEPKKFEHYFEIYGSVESNQNVSVNLEAPGIITRINVEVGQKVAKGQTLGIVDAEVLRNSIDELKTGLELAVTVYIKQEQLWKQEIGSELQYLEAKNRKESLEQKLNTLNSQLDMYTITAPFNGVVDEIFYKTGEMGNMMMPFMRLVNLNDVYLVADISEEYLGTVVPGVSVIASFPSLDIEYDATISRVGTYIKANNRTFKIYIDLTNNESLLKPNLLGVINIKDFELDSATVVPTSTIQQDAAGKEFLFVLQHDGDRLIAVKTPIKSGMSYGKETLVLEGISGVEDIVFKGARNIKDGQEVKI